MIKNKLLFFLVCFTIKFIRVYSQASSDNNYIIITYEQSQSKSFEGIKRTFWIVPIDSIVDQKVNLCPLLLTGYYRNDTENCRTGKEIDPYISLSTEENELDTIQKKALDKLYDIIYFKRRKVQTIQKTWSSGNQEKIIIYVTPVRGSFFFCNFNYTGLKRSGYGGLLCIPYSRIEDITEFWKMAESKSVISYDFSKCNFDYNILYNELPNWKKYSK
jgi:hypothetical protein